VDDVFFPEESSSVQADMQRNPQIEKVAAFCGLRLNRVPRVKDIEHEVVCE
jgi:hypothetical protein